MDDGEQKTFPRSALLEFQRSLLKGFEPEIKCIKIKSWLITIYQKK